MNWRQYAPHPLTLVSAVLIVFAFPPWNYDVLIWFSLIPWLWVLRTRKILKFALLESFWLGFFTSLGGYYWVAYAIHNYGNLPWAISVLGLLLFCTFCQIQFSIFTLIYFLLRVSPVHKEFGAKHFLSCVLIAALYTMADWIIPKLSLIHI